MSEKIKFTEDELQTINTIQESYLNLQDTFGKLSVNRIRLEDQLEHLGITETEVRKQFQQNQMNEKNFINQIEAKYGDGSLDLTTGEFTSKNKEDGITTTYAEEPPENTDKTL